MRRSRFNNLHPKRCPTEYRLPYNQHSAWSEFFIVGRWKLEMRWSSRASARWYFWRRGTGAVKNLLLWLSLPFLYGTAVELRDRCYVSTFKRAMCNEQREKRRIILEESLSFWLEFVHSFPL
uniref:Golgi apparatus membrane protein TVP23 n=1 Tax=Rhizophora mucronata TaxID=61149 RepID=A0A2P2JTA5_RHIMU